MTIQLAIGILFLGSSVVYGAYMMRSIWTDRGWLAEAPGRFGTVFGLTTVIYFLCTIGVSDFLLNTILCRRMHLAEPAAQPDCNICATIVPSGIIAFLYLRNADAVDGLLLAVFIVCMVVGSLVGSRAVGRMEGEWIRKAMVIFLCVTLAALIIKMILSAGAAPTATSLSGWKLAAIGAEAFCAGFINMLGIPAKPLTATVALILGLSPVTTLAITLGAIPMSCVAGGINVAPRKKYNPKLILSAMTGGAAAAIIGSLLAISINAALLNGILLVVIATAIISLIK
jgi:uncharacterized membrane protein YfcA